MTANFMRTVAYACALCMAFFALSGCNALPVSAQPAPAGAEVLDLPAHTPLLEPAPEPAAIPSPTPEPEATPEPLPVYATIGVVGDIMMMQSQISGAWSEQLQVYDFTPSFRAMQPYFQGVDLLCGNLETPLAGEETGYSGPAPTAAVILPDGTMPEKERQKFNAPDDLASSLKQAGFDVITTANNHTLDRGADGMVRTAEVLRAAGLMQLGTYVSPLDRQTPRIADINGIRVGLLAWTFSVNGYEEMLSSDQRAYAVGRTGDRERIAEDIRLSKEAGAEFLIAFVHWDAEFMQKPASSTKKLARFLLEQGVDAVMGSHPHVVQPAEYVTLQRGETEYTGLVVYSLGNFISNMSPSPRDYGLYVQMMIEKKPDGTVRLLDARLLPTYCCKHRVEGRTLHEVLPALEDACELALLYGVDESKLLNTREHVLSVCGEGVLPLSNVVPVIVE